MEIKFEAMKALCIDSNDQSQFYENSTCSQLNNLVQNITFMNLESRMQLWTIIPNFIHLK